MDNGLPKFNCLPQKRPLDRCVRVKFMKIPEQFFQRTPAKSCFFFDWFEINLNKESHKILNLKNSISKKIRSVVSLTIICLLYGLVSFSRSSLYS